MSERRFKRAPDVVLTPDEIAAAMGPEWCELARQKYDQPLTLLPSVIEDHHVGPVEGEASDA